MQLKNNKQLGFTIVELMIATLVFSVIMLISLAAFIQINRLYTKGLSIAKTQEAVRNVISELSNRMQYSADDPYSNGNYVCIGTKKYSFSLNTPEDSSGSALKSEDVTDSGSCNILASPSNKKVLLPKNTRVLSFIVTNTAGSPIHDITVSLLFAPNDGSCSINSACTDLVDTKGDVGGSITNIDNWRCKGGISGSEYCSLSKITTTVFKRT
jgi:prepilin-type N-terminal cleavage/methylation domain-containing protein